MKYKKIQNKKTSIIINIKDISPVIRRYQIAANNNHTTYCTEHTYSYITVNKITDSNK